MKFILCSISYDLEKEESSPLFKVTFECVFRLFEISYSNTYYLLLLKTNLSYPTEQIAL